MAEVQAFGDLGLMQVDAVLAAESVQHGNMGWAKCLARVWITMYCWMNVVRSRACAARRAFKVVQLLNLPEEASPSGCRAARVLLHLAVVQSHFTAGEVGVAPPGVGCRGWHTDFDAAGHGVIKGFFKGRARGDVQRDAFFVVAQLGKAGAELDGFATSSSSGRGWMQATRSG